jgi:hypothetical protein
MPATTATRAAATAINRACRKLRPSAKPVRVGMTIIALTRSTPTSRMVMTVVRAVSVVSMMFSASTRTPLVRARSSFRVIASKGR